VGSPAARRRLVQSFCSIGTILPSRPARGPCRRAQRRSRMARLRATASAARSVLDGCEHDGMLSRVGSRLPKLTNRTIKRRETKHIKKQDHAHSIKISESERLHRTSYNQTTMSPTKTGTSYSQTTTLLTKTGMLSTKISESWRLHRTSYSQTTMSPTRQGRSQ
jgi:hypothetical protein